MSSSQYPRLLNVVQRAVRFIVVLMILLAAIGCTNKNVRLNAANLPLERRIRNHTRASFALDPVGPGDQANRSGFFVGIAISGGGSRSANFSAACMLQLQRIGLLQNVDYISSVSGGSLTAAYYCLSDDQRWNPEQLQRLLSHRFASDLIRHFLMPWNIAITFFTDYDRSDLLAEIFQSTLYTDHGRGLTFADLRRDRPRLLINATDLQSGHRFVFNDETFDEINSDLSRYPIAWACAASAAVPVLLHQVTLRDYSTIFKQYRHFIDGGIADNLGIQTLVEMYDSQTQAAATAHRPPPYPNGAIFVVIDAKTRFNARLSDKGDISFLESLEFGSGLTSTALLARASTASMSELIVRYAPGEVTAEALRQSITELETNGYLETQDRNHAPIHIVHLALSQVNGLGNVPYQGFSESLDNIATYFNIEPTDTYNLYQAADLLVKQKFESVLRKLVTQIDQKRTATP
jgi:predicted acylesterase/phospholipase RssA